MLKVGRVGGPRYAALDRQGAHLRHAGRRTQHTAGLGAVDPVEAGACVPRTGAQYWERVAWLTWQAYDGLMALRARPERIKQQEIARIDSIPARRASRASYNEAGLIETALRLFDRLRASSPLAIVNLFGKEMRATFEDQLAEFTG